MKTVVQTNMCYQTSPAFGKQIQHFLKIEQEEVSAIRT
jgi:hypothetical protein